MKAFTMERVSIDVTYKCSLKCRLCNAYVPYMDDALLRNYPIETWLEIIDRYFKIVDYVKIFSISGGEPCIYPDLPAILTHLKNYHNKQIGEIQFVTNGTMIPNQRILDVSKEFGEKLYFIVDNYGPEISTKISAIDDLMTKQNIRHIIRNYTDDNPHCGGWVDFGNLTEQRLKNQEEAEQLFKKCAFPQKMHFCFPISGTEMWPCPPARRRRQLGLSDDYSEYINFFDDSLSIEEQQEKIRLIYEKKSLSACAYCSGLCEDSERFIPGEQMTQEELSYIKAGARSYEEVLSMMAAKRSDRKR